jgi:hypothetical protein
VAELTLGSAAKESPAACTSDDRVVAGALVPAGAISEVGAIAGVVSHFANWSRQQLRRDVPLRDEGVLEFRRGRGITAAPAPERGAVTARARELVTFARQHGYDQREFIEFIANLDAPVSIRSSTIPVDLIARGEMLVGRLRRPSLPAWERIRGHPTPTRRSPSVNSPSPPHETTPTANARGNALLGCDVTR